MNPPEIILMHLSDIHFYDFDVAKGQIDLNEELRNELERDAVRLAQTVGHVDGILVSGDIAFGGKPEQYSMATHWLDKLRRLIGSPAQNVWTIPGNHDIHRPAINNSLHIPDMHAKLRNVEVRDLDSTLASYLGHRDGDALFAPIANYNAFATPYGCTSTRLKPYWEHDLNLNDGSYLRLLGLNSAIISDELDNKQTQRLILGEKQSKPYNITGVTYLAMCHHPPDWLRDEDAAIDNLISRTAVQLFGHKHKLRHQKVTRAQHESLVIAAGAVHPSRKEDDWKPRYNVLSIRVVNSDVHRHLEVKIWPRIYAEDNRFVPDRDPDSGSEFYIYHVRLENWDGNKPVVPMSTHKQFHWVGMEPGTLEDADLIDRLISLAERSPRDFGLRLWMETEESGRTERDFIPKTLAAEPHIRLGDRATICAQADRDCYLWIVNVGSTGRKAIVFPGLVGATNAVAAHEIVRVPGIFDGKTGLETFHAFASKTLLVSQSVPGEVRAVRDFLVDVEAVVCADGSQLCAANTLQFALDKRPD